MRLKIGTIRGRYPYLATSFRGLPCGLKTNERPAKRSSLRMNVSLPHGNPLSMLRLKVFSSPVSSLSANHLDQTPIALNCFCQTALLVMSVSVYK